MVENTSIITQDYINIDSFLETSGMCDDDEIISLIQEPEEEPQEESQEEPQISNAIALESVQNLFKYMNQKSNLNINNSLVVGLRNLHHQIRKNQINSLKQVDLNSFFDN